MNQLPMMTGMQQSSPFAGFGMGMPSFGAPSAISTSPVNASALGGSSQNQMATLNGLLESVMQMMQSLMGLGQGNNPLTSQPNFGAQGNSVPGMGALNDFLGGVSNPKAGGGHRRRRAQGGGRAHQGSRGGGGSSSGGGGGSSPSVGSSGGGGSTTGGAKPSSGSSTGGSSPTGSTSSTGSTSADLPNGAKGLTFAKAAELVKKGGGQVNPGGKPTVLALRSKTTATSGYQDTFVVLKPDGTLKPFAASSRPTSSGQDRAMLKPGAYEISPRWRDGRYNDDAFVVKSQSGSSSVGVGRDSNGDGQWSDKEMKANTSSDLIRLHRGNSNTTSSTGCLNVKDYDGFLKEVGGRDSSYNLVLVNQN